MIGRRSQDDAQSFEEAWNGRAPHDAHIADLVAFAESLCEAAVVEPSPQFRTDLRARLMSEAATVLVPAPAAALTTPAAPAVRQTRRGRRRVAGLTAALIASAGTVSLVASSASAVPGEMLYPVKRTVESVELTLHRSDASRGSFQLAQASERLSEARRLSDRGASEDLIVDTLDDFSAAAFDGSTRLFSDFADRGQETSVRTVSDFAVAATVDLSELSSTLPESATDSFSAATDAVTQLATEASSLCASCAHADVQSLVKAVTGLSASGSTAAPQSSAQKPAKDAPAASPATSKDEPASSGGPGSGPTPAPSQSPAAPAPTPTKTPSLTDITDPLLGGLLGDEEQVGLVPGLLNGLLGKK